jgi:hypothetical protein
MDAHTQQDTLVKQSTICAAVFARGVDVALVELTGKPDVVDQSAALTVAGFNLEGFIGLVGKDVQIAPDRPLDVMCMFAMGRAHATFANLIAALPQQTKCDSASWLERLALIPNMPEKFGPA